MNAPRILVLFGSLLALVLVASASILAAQAQISPVQAVFNYTLLIPLEKYAESYTLHLLMPWCVKQEYPITFVLTPWGSERQFIIIRSLGTLAYPPPNTTIESSLILVDKTTHLPIPPTNYGVALLQHYVHGGKLVIKIILYPTKHNIPSNLTNAATIIPLTTLASVNTTNATIYVDFESLIDISSEDYFARTISAIYIDGIITKPIIYIAEVEVPFTNEYVRSLPLLYQPYQLGSEILYVVPGFFDMFQPEPVVRFGNKLLAAKADCNNAIITAVLYADKDTTIDSITASVLAGLLVSTRLTSQHPIIYGVPAFYVDVFQIRLPSPLYVPAGSTAVINVKINVYRVG